METTDQDKNIYRNEVTLLRPHPAIYKNEHNTAVRQTIAENSWIYILEKPPVYTKHGIFRYFKGVKYPEKGFPNPDAMNVVNRAKRVFMTFIGIISHPLIFPFLAPIALLPYKYKLRIVDFALHNVNRILDWDLAPFYLHRYYYTEAARGLRHFTFLLLRSMGIHKGVAKKTAEVICAFMQYDDQYRYRVQDIFTATSKEELLLNPRREVMRLSRLARQREHTVGEKFAMFYKLLSYMLLHPRFKKAFIRAVQLTDLSDIQFDSIDEYWILTRGGYDYMGLSLDRRLEKLTMSFGETPPPMMKIELVKQLRGE